MLLSITEPGAPIVETLTPAQLSGMQQAVDRVAASMDDPTVVPLSKPLDPAAAPQDLPENQRWAVDLGVRSENGYGDVTTYVATPEVLRYLGIDPSELPAATQVLTTETEDLYFLTQTDRGNEQAAEHVVPLAATYSSLPATLITESTSRERGWATAPAGWLVESGDELTGDQIAAAREMAAELGLLVEVRRDYSNPDLRAISVSGGMLVSLGIVAMTVGLIRSQAVDDLRILAATGAARRIRRALTAATAGALTTLGVLLGGFGAYLGLAAAYVREPSILGRVPVVELLVIVVGTPLLASGAAWLFGGREPPSLARRD